VCRDIVPRSPRAVLLVVPGGVERELLQCLQSPRDACNGCGDCHDTGGSDCAVDAVPGAAIPAPQLIGKEPSRTGSKTKHRRPGSDALALLLPPPQGGPRDGCPGFALVSAPSLSPSASSTTVAGAGGRGLARKRSRTSARVRPSSARRALKGGGPRASWFLGLAPGCPRSFGLSAPALALLMSCMRQAAYGVGSVGEARPHEKSHLRR
jgi:hypothetical protein